MVREVVGMVCCPIVGIVEFVPRAIRVLGIPEAKAACFGVHPLVIIVFVGMGEAMACIGATVCHDVETEAFVPNNGRQPRVPAKIFSVWILIGIFKYGLSFFNMFCPDWFVFISHEIFPHISFFNVLFLNPG